MQHRATRENSKIGDIPGRVAMRFVERFVDHYLRLTEHSKTTRALVYGVTIFLVLFGLDLLSDFLGKGWLGEHIPGDLLAATVLAIIGSHISQLREERILRRERQVQYLNHHVRNALTLLKMLEQQLEARQANVVHSAADRICLVVEQLSRDEDVRIDREFPEIILRPQKSRMA